MRKFLFAAALTVVPMTWAMADGFDGTYRALAPWVSNRCTASYVDATVQGGTVTAALNAIHFSGPLNADGTFRITGERNYIFTGQIVGDRFVVRWDGQCGPREATGGRIGTTAKW
jgi:hypothetical protein